jgi:hypothetical protein
MGILQNIRDCGERASNCLLVALIQYAENEIRKNTPETINTVLQVESCITKLAKLTALGEFDLDINILKYYLLRVSHFSVGLNEALQSHQSGGLAFALAEIGQYFYLAHIDGRNIGMPDFTINEVAVMSQAIHFILSRVYPSLIGLSSPADMEFLRANFWDDGRDLDILHELLGKLQAL